MIYILTPNYPDFKRICLNEGFQEAIWVDNPIKLGGRKIFKDDIVIKGRNFYLFPNSTIDRFEMELQLRRTDDIRNI